MKWRNWHYRFSFKTKILGLVLSVSIISISLMAMFTSYYYTESAKNDFYMIAQDSTARMNHQLDRYFTQMAQSTYASIAGPLPSNSMLGDNPESGLLQKWLISGHMFSREQEALVEGIMSKYIAINYSNVLGIVLRSIDNRLIYSKDHSLSHPMIDYSPWLSSPLADRLTIVPSHYRPQDTLMAAYPFITLSVPVFNPNSLKLIGNLNIALSMTEIEDILGQTRLGKTGFFFIVDSNGKIVYHPDVALAGRRVEDTVIRALPVGGHGTVVKRNGEKILMSSNRSDLTGWILVASVPVREMASGLDFARKATMYVMSGIIVISLFLIPRMVDQVVRPILRLRNLMKQVENGDTSVRAEVITGKDEIQQLNGSFNQMTSRLNELIHTVHRLEINEMQLQLRQRDAHIRALQNQINPHLLYNTLEIIKSIAFIEKVPTIEKMVTSLAAVYRYSSKMPGAEVLLRDELKNLQHYLEIIHIRFDHFHSSISVDEACMDCRVIKLSLQPIVENSVKYAVEPKNGNARITITAYEHNGDLIIDISDNGNGFPEEDLARITHGMKLVEQHSEPAEEESVGIINVHSRMALKYGSPYGVSVHSFPGKGSKVSLRFPKKINS
ncbi:hypothetical protein BBD41_00765 [Paenibacillus ihbetae]|uniref:HAMP domain-containing protein n=1 Tax=Paenibacillus ihbetae TaxID=1870820 RepID=A0A1B2DU48_9BACL|nr:sensor histidine kinase [Paenibacillus ihbetae]ANY71235.1 hypothetical protein BBD41_00765 [Paenibacillus ihbetae]